MPPSPPQHPKSPHLDPPPPTTPNCPTWTPPPQPTLPEPPPPAPPIPPPFALPEPPPQMPPQGASGQQLVGGVVGVQNRGVAPPVSSVNGIHDSRPCPVGAIVGLGVELAGSCAEVCDEHLTRCTAALRT